MLLLAGLAFTAFAYETDQFTGRSTPLADSREVLNDLVNRQLEDICARWPRHAGRRDKRMAKEVFWHLGGLHWVDKVERWAMRSGAVERLVLGKKGSVYSGLPVHATRVIGAFGVGPSLRLNDVYIGSDKFGHFLSQGRKYFRRYLRTGSHEGVVRHGQRNERGIFGATTTNVYSNADLVANYEGYLFYRSLSEDGIVAGKAAIIGWRHGSGGRSEEGDRPFVQRPFDWADHVNDFWDEALNPSHYGKGLKKHLRPVLAGLCDEYREDPSSWVPRDEEALRARYAHLGLREDLDMRLDRICAPSDAAAAD